MNNLKRAFLSTGLLVISFLFASCGLNNQSKSLVIKTLPNTLTYEVDSRISYEGIEVTDEKGVEVDDYYFSIAEGMRLLTVGNKKITVSKDGYNSTYFNINVIPAEQPTLVVYAMPNQTEYDVGDNLSLDGLFIKDTNNNVVTDYETSMQDGEKLNTPGNFTITVSKTGYVSTSFSIHVSQPIVNQLTVDTLPTKVDYKKGENLSFAGLIVTCNEKVVNNYTLKINGSIVNDGTKINDLGTIRVDVSKDNYLDTHFSIFVGEEVAPSTSTKYVKFYYMNDTHGAFIRQNTTSNSYETGMSCLSKALRNYRTNKPEETVVLSGGDMFQGGWESNQTRGKIMADAMNIAGFDAMVLGNHEFDWGEETMKETLDILDFPVLTCNIFYSSDNVTRPNYVEPYTIIQKNGLKVGIIGAIEKNIQTSIVGSVSSLFYYPDPVPYIQEYSDLLRTTYNCNVVVAALHDGGFDSYNDPTFEGITLTSEITGKSYVDGVFLAHDHQNKTGQVNGVYYLESGKNGRSLGMMNITLKPTSNVYNVTNVSVTNVTNAYAEYTINDSEVDALLTKYASEIGTDSLLYTFKYSHTKYEFAELLAESLYWYVNKNKSLFDNTTVYFATHNVGGIRVSTIASGEFTMSDLTTVVPFDNDICIQKCTSQNISYMSSSSAYANYYNGTIEYKNGITNAVTINYIAENETYGPRCQQSFTKYNINAKTALIAYLKSGEYIEQ